MVGDCSENLKEFSGNNIRDTFQVLLQMGIVLTYGAQILVIKVQFSPLSVFYFIFEFFVEKWICGSELLNACLFSFCYLFIYVNVQNMHLGIIEKSFAFCFCLRTCKERTCFATFIHFEETNILIQYS